jgi:hypothetical protein
LTRWDVSGGFFIVAKANVITLRSVLISGISGEILGFGLPIPRDSGDHGDSGDLCFRSVLSVFISGQISGFRFRRS